MQKPSTGVLDLFVAQVGRTPAAIAASHAGESLSYRELDARSDGYAGHLRGLGVGIGGRVGICVERGLDLAVVVLAVLKTGAAYVPLDPAYPPQRLAMMVADSDADLVVCSPGHRGLFNGVERLVSFDAAAAAPDATAPADEPLAPPALADSLAYLIYTSGSTGRPKAVALPHRALANLVHWQLRQPGFAEPARVLQFTPLSFDVHFQEFFCTWCCGGELVFIDDRLRRDGVSLLRFLREARIERLFLPFVGLQQLADAALQDGQVPESLKEVVTAGEQLQINRTIAGFFAQLPQCRLHNQYGPSESHVVTAHTLAGPVAEWPRLPPIGRPIDGAQILLLDAALRQVPAGETGELCIGGICLANGYWGREELTRERFIQHPLAAGDGRLYRTGDLARWEANGDITYLGRIDGQVKIRGHRVEIGEIEAALDALPAVRESAVAARGEGAGDRRLVAYLTLNDDTDDADLSEEQARWRALWETAYQRGDVPADPAFDSRGWNSSYTGAPLSADELQQWRDGAADRVLAVAPRRVLEIQSGLGLLAHRLAPLCEYYCAVDSSAVAVERLRQALPAQAGTRRVEQLAPDAIGALAEERFDTVVINAASQYFASADYLAEVLGAAAGLLADGGTIFVGDVSSRAARALFHTAVEAERARPGDAVGKLRSTIARRLGEDRELALDPGFFYGLGARIPVLRAVEVQLKPGRYHNELSQFRYDVLLHVGAGLPPVASVPAWLDWDEQGLDLPALERLLAQDVSAPLAVRGIANARLGSAAAVAALLGADGIADCAALRERLPATVRAGWEPEDFYALAQRAGRRVQLLWSAEPDRFDAVFAPAGDGDWHYQPPADGRPLRSHANRPLDAVRFPRLVKALREQLAAALPDYMQPGRYVLLDRMPLTPSGKLDRRALPEPAQARPELEQPYLEPAGETERQLAGLWAELLELDRVGADDDFFELGGNSLKAQLCCAELKVRHQLQLPVAALYEHATVRGIARYLQDRERFNVDAATLRAGDDVHDIAVIGLAGRFPGARTVAELWRNLCDGVEATTFFTDAELDPSIPAELRADPNYVKARGLVPEAEYFDAAFFGFNAREADITDPQQRIFLETAWEALEDAAVVPGGGDRVGVFAGVGVNGYYVHHVLPRRGADAGVSEIQRIIATEKDYVASRVAHKLNLTGPALSVSTACSTSLVAVIEACMSLRNGFCELAIAGGASVHAPLHSGYLYQEEGALSPDGLTRSFDQDAAGTAFNGGAGAVVLKPLHRARADGDRIYAVIRGVGLNNDGGDKASFMAPSVRGQAEAIVQAQRDAGVDPRSISYIEAHGTATPIGDPIEVEALTRAFRFNSESRDAGFCGIGSLKSNVGHLIAAAGVAGLIKTCLALHHRQLPATLHYRAPNPEIDFASGPFFVVDRLLAWEQNSHPLRAGVSSFGVGGTNAHVVLEQAPAPVVSPVTQPAPELLLLSARDGERLQAQAQRLAEHFEHAGEPLAAAAWTLQKGRARFKQRRFVVADHNTDAAEALRGTGNGRAGAWDGIGRGVVFMFPGQGSQYVGMGLGLYQRYSAFRAVFDDCCDRLAPLLGSDLRTLLFPTAGADPDALAEQLRETRYTQPALFVVEYALARWWMALGVEPTALIGHSIGEFVAATLAGVFSLDDGLRLVAERARLMQAQPPGAMLAVQASAESIAPQLPASCAIAAINGPELCVVSGPFDAMEPLAQRLREQGIGSKTLHTSHAFHSPMMEPVIEPFAAVLELVTLQPPERPILSTVTAQWLTPEQAQDRGYWARHLRETVRFADGVRALLAGEPAIYLEVGPRNTAATLAAQQMRGLPRQPVVASLGAAPVPGDAFAEQRAWLAAAGELWLQGRELAWPALHGAALPPVVSLPTYPFARERHWLEALPAADAAAATVAMAVVPSMPLFSEPVVEPNLQGQGLMSQQELLIADLRTLFAENSGEDLTDVAPETSFLELGFDSLFLTQAALALKKRYKVDVPFRRLLSDLGDFNRLAALLQAEADPGMLPVAVAAAPLPVASAAPMQAMVQQPWPAQPLPAAAGVQALIQQQLQLMARQLEMLGAAPIALPPGAVIPPSAPVPQPPAAAVPAPRPVAKSVAEPPLATEPPATEPPAKAFGAQTRIDTTGKDDFTPRQREFFQQLVAEYGERTGRSKAHAEQHRPHLADPRVVSGFRPAVKEIIYPIVVERSKGCRLWDLDGNEYIDTLCGYGSMYFGYQADWIVAALTAQLEQGMEIGPQHPLAGEVAAMLAEIIPQPRFAFCNTGSEAVLGALRMARTATGRSKVVAFNGGYHGINDEVIVRGGRNLKSFPAAAGIPAEAVQNMLILDYGSDEALDIIRANADDLAAVLVEVVQSRHPALLPVEFLQKLRKLTEELDIALIFDEVITGFRAAPGGMQEYLGIRADIATYGKIIGGGVSLGIIGGQERYMDTLDGGAWQFGDDSKPEVGVTYFAGTFVRHPLALAAAKAVLEYMRAQGPQLQREVNERATRHAAALNLHFRRVGAPMVIEQFCSMMYFKFTEDLPFGDLLFADMRRQGIHIWYGRPMFVSAAHTEDDLARIREVFMRALARMQEWGFIPGNSLDTHGRELAPPVAGARLGLDRDGNPAWFVEGETAGSYQQVGSSFD